MSIPLTILTGALGAGKTTLIQAVLPHLQDVAYLKSEFGPINTDSALISNTQQNNTQKSNLLATIELSNGCLCCTQVGQLKESLKELIDKYTPKRIIYETSGSAFPASIALQINEMTKNDPEPLNIHIDAIVTVIDCINFVGYEDKSYTAKIQAKYTDLILMNKSHLVDERQYDDCLDHVRELNEDTPIFKTDENGGISPDILFGVDIRPKRREVDAGQELHRPKDHHSKEVDLIRLCVNLDIVKDYDLFEIVKPFLNSLQPSEFYRIKGFMRHRSGHIYIINWSFGRGSMTKAGSLDLMDEQMSCDLIFMVECGSIRQASAVWHNICNTLANGTDLPCTVLK